MTIIALLLVLIFAAIGSIHFYWAMGGKAGLQNATPTNPETEASDKLFEPGPLATIIVGIGLLFFGSLFLHQIIPFLPVPEQWINYGILAVAIIFSIRAIGDFKYAGFTKRIRNTDFARMDTRYYSPLCLVIAIGAFLIYFF